MYLLENVFLLDGMFNLMAERYAAVKIMTCTYFCSLNIMKQILTYFRTFLHEDIANNFGYTHSFFKTFLSIHVALSLSEVAKKYLNYQDSKQVIRIKNKTIKLLISNDKDLLL